MGTAITLSLNGIDIDWGKNDYWRAHHWLFPPGSVTDVEYRYAQGVTEVKPGFETTLGEAHFRLRHLGYSFEEARTKFETAVERWNRTADLGVTFDGFRDVLTSIDFAVLTSSDLEPFIWDFRRFVVSLLARWDTEDARLEDFIFGLDFSLTLRVLGDRVGSGTLPLRWHHQDLVDSGWASVEDLTDIDRKTYMVNHTVLVGRLQDHARADTVRAFDRWLEQQGLARTTTYVRANSDGSAARETTTLPTAVRNMIHHPENPHNILTDDNLRESVELLLSVAKRVPGQLAGLI